MTRLFSLLTSVCLTVTMLLAFVMISRPAEAAFFDSSKDQACKGATISSGGGACDKTAGDKLNNVIRTIINLFSVIVGIIAVVMIIVGGVKYITSGGASEKVTGAKNTILYAVIGLIVVAFAQIIVRFVLSKASKATQ